MAENAEQPQGVSFHDYHRTIIGYHGTTAEVAERLVNGDPFEPSDNDDDWFGTGIYFWEYAPKQAWWWAAEFKRYPQPAVVGAVIRLGHCFDLLDPVNVMTLRAFHADAVAGLAGFGFQDPGERQPAQEIRLCDLQPVVRWAEEEAAADRDCQGGLCANRICEAGLDQELDL